MKIVLFLIFIAAVIVRLLYFPNNIYFGFDQARDAYASLEILKGDLKLIGPTTAFEGLHHGVLYYYILAPLYGFGNMSPEFTAAVLRILNALGVFLIFLTAKTIFSNRVGIMAAILFAFSFEQSQFSIYMGNPTLAVLSVLIMYLGLALVIFTKKGWGLPLAVLGFGMSVQFQFALSYLIIPLILILTIYRKIFFRLSIKIWGFSLLFLVLSLGTFLLAELKYNFPTLHGLLAISQSGAGKNFGMIFSTYFYTINKMVAYNLTNNLSVVTAFILGGLFIWFVKKEKKLIFLSLWFFSLVITFFVNGGVDIKNTTPLYYPNVGVSISLLIFVAFLIDKITFKFLSIALIGAILLSNLSLIKVFNPKGNFSEISVQQGMIIGDQKEVLNRIYDEVSGQPFAVKAVTMPLFVNTTWSYLFEWYGKEKYGYVPIWNGKNAQGYPGNLIVDEKQETVPEKRFLIIEPTRGIEQYLIDDYIKEEDYFTKVVDEESIGAFIIQKREKF
jgi:hypothetical protein